MKKEEENPIKKNPAAEEQCEESCEESCEEPSSGPGVLRCSWLALVLFPTSVAGSFGLPLVPLVCCLVSFLVCPVFRGPARVRVRWPGFLYIFSARVCLAWTLVCFLFGVFVWTFLELVHPKLGPTLVRLFTFKLVWDNAHIRAQASGALYNTRHGPYTGPNPGGDPR